MPGGDGTGPAGQGPATGWGRGGCTPYGSGYYGRGGRGFGFGRGWGRGRGRGFWGYMPWNWGGSSYGEPTSDDLKAELSYLENEQKGILGAIDEIKKTLGKDKK